MKFGDGRQKNEYLEEYDWGNDLSGKAIMILRYDKTSEATQFIMYSSKIFSKKTADEKKNANAKAKKGVKDF